jgi:hypothetical protein
VAVWRSRNELYELYERFRLTQLTRRAEKAREVQPLLYPLLLIQGPELLCQSQLHYLLAQAVHFGHGQVPIHHRCLCQSKLLLNRLRIPDSPTQGHGRTRKHLMKKEENIPHDNNTWREK